MHSLVNGASLPAHQDLHCDEGLIVGPGLLFFEVLVVGPGLLFFEGLVVGPGVLFFVAAAQSKYYK